MTLPMTLTERYLKAVAAQLPRASREDIVAELRDLLQTRMEDREEELGRPLTEADEEAVLREFGHPLAVAARYGSGPLHIVGPELYPWWMFGVKVALAAMVCIIAIGMVVRVVIGDVSVGQGIGQAFHDAFGGGITIVGLATVGAYILERQKVRPAFLTQWRVKDLGLFELGGFDTDAMSRRLAETGTIKPARGTLSPTARALGSAAAWVVLLLWWIGLLNVAQLRPEDLGAVADGVDYGLILGQVVDVLYWPVIVYAGFRILFDLIRAAHPENLRLTALGDIGFGAAQAALFVWLWQASPLTPLIRVDSLAAFIERVRVLFDGGFWSLATILMVCVGFGAVQSLFKVSGAVWRLITGRIWGGDVERVAAAA